MNILARRALPVLVLALAGCGGGSGDELVISTGLKIFATKETHVGNFAADPTLTGGNAVQKADDFCNRSISKPDTAIYKALLVDGTTRIAPTGSSSGTDWVLQPNTTYYRAYYDVPIDTTGSIAILPAYFYDMDASFSACNPGECDAWTGIADASTFAADTDNCGGWGATTSGTPHLGWMGQLDAVNGSAVSHTEGACNESGEVRARVICVQQP